MDLPQDFGLPTPQQLPELAALRALAERYAWAIDFDRGDVLAALFHEDGVLHLPARGELRGCERIATLPAAIRERYLRTFHAVFNQVARIDGDSAQAQTYCIARHLLPAPMGNQLCYEMTIVYDDRFERRGAQGWRFAERRLNLHWSHVHQASQPPGVVA